MYWNEAAMDKGTTPVNGNQGPAEPDETGVRCGRTGGGEIYKPVSWCYLFVHHRKVMAFEEQLKTDGLTYFIHKTVRYVQHRKTKGGVNKLEKPTVSGLVFIQGDPNGIQKYLDEKMQPHRLCRNCSTGRPAIIPCSQMEPFMRIAESDPERLRFLLRPFAYYSRNRTLLRIVSGDYAGMEGYVIRIARDRRLVMDFGGIAVAVTGIHAERFEEVDKNRESKKDRAVFYERNLHERNAFIDRYFHRVKTAQDVVLQAENISMLHSRTLADAACGKLDLKDVLDIFGFMIEEIGYYYAPFVGNSNVDLASVFNAGRAVMDEMEGIIGKLGKDSELRQRSETEYEELKIKYGYLFG